MELVDFRKRIIQKKDYIVLPIAFLGLIAWYFTKEAAIALYIVLLIDAAGTYLTVEKAYHHPETETILLWIFSSLAGFFAMLAVGGWDIILLSYPLFVFLADTINSYCNTFGETEIKHVMTDKAPHS